MTKVSIVISNYNYGMFVDSAIESCLAQSYQCDVIVVDDASSDNSWDIIQSYVKHGVTAVRLKENSGGNARGKNVGICLSESDFVTCLDSDDMLLPNSISTRMKAFADDVDFIQGWSAIANGNESYMKFIKNGVGKQPFKRSRKGLALMKEEFSPRWSFAIQASTVLARNKLYDRFGLYDEAMRWTIDREMWWRWLSHSANIAIVDAYVSLYRKHKGQLTSDRSRKDPKTQQGLLRNRREMRQQITRENTMFPQDYDFMSYVEGINS